jgi:nucleoside-diphosphate-sugar epimerase
LIGKKILVSGASGFLGFSLALELARTNEVHGMARFRHEPVRKLAPAIAIRNQVK